MFLSKLFPMISIFPPKSSRFKTDPIWMKTGSENGESTFEDVVTKGLLPP